MGQAQRDEEKARKKPSAEGGVDRVGRVPSSHAPALQSHAQLLLTFGSSALVASSGNSKV